MTRPPKQTGNRSATTAGTPHDRLFRATLSDGKRAAAFLRDHLPNEIAGLLADTEPVIMEGTFVDEALAASQSDVLLKVELKSGKPAYAYVLAEHQSRPSPALPLRMAGYMLKIWIRHAGDRAEDLRALPPIIPILVFTGKERWNVAASITEMIAADDPALAILPGSSYILRNLGTMEIKDLSTEPALRAGLITLKREALTHLAEVVAGLPQDSTYRRQIMEYILRVYDDLDIAEFRQRLRQVDMAEDLEAIVGTIADTLLEQGSEQGFAKGLAEGKADDLSRLLSRRFGALPRAINDRIAAASIETLDRWFDDAIDADSLEAVFGGS